MQGVAVGETGDSVGGVILLNRNGDNIGAAHAAAGGIGKAETKPLKSVESSRV